MRSGRLALLAIGAGLALIVAALMGSARAATPATPAAPAEPAAPAGHTVTFDHYSLKIDGRRTYIWSGEFHYWRLPSPDAWRDVLQKMRAAGFNATSIYFDWGYHSPAPGKYDFTGVRDVDKLLDIADQAGIYVIARPAPYINAETDGGGLPGWLVTQQGRARSAAADYVAASREWLRHIDPILARHQLTNGTGSVIAYQVENEYGLNTETAYMQALEQQARADGITVPLTHNHCCGPSTWATGPGAVDLPGEDSYPQGFNCSNPAQWHQPGPLPRFRDDSPIITNEFGSGSFDPWGGPGYDKCRILTGPDYERVFYKNNIASGATFQNFYMTYGGTSWGWLAAPGAVYSSYDYGAPITESRQLTAKYDEMKRLGTFATTVAPLAETDPAAPPAAPSDHAIREDLRANPETGTQFAVLRHTDGTSTADDATTIALATRDGSYPVVPQQGAIPIRGRDSHVVVAGYDMGAAHLVYSTSEIFTNATIGGRDVAVLYGRDGSGGETVLRYAARPAVTVQQGRATVTWDAARGDLRLNYTHAGAAPVRVLISGGGAARDLELVLVSDAGAARFWRLGQVLVNGPYLVRTASVSGGTVRLTGDTSARGSLEVWAPGVSRVTWNGVPLAVSATASGSLLGTVPGPPPAVRLPALTWRSHDDTAEAALPYDDSSWVRALHQPMTGDAYGFHHGYIWYRGHFRAHGSESSVSLNAGTGTAGVFAAWLNGRYLGSAPEGGHDFPIPAGVLRKGKDNVVAVLVGAMGHDEDFAATDSHKSPRGLTAASVAGFPGTIDWRIQGARGGETPLDPARGPLNVGGLGGERAGWYLPGYPDAKWRGAPPSKPGVTWYRSTFGLSLPAHTDVPLAVSVADSPAGHYRSLIFVNGWQIGVYINDLGPQHVFPVPPGILRPDGRNTIAVAVWSLDAAGGGPGKVTLTRLGEYASGIGVGGDVASPGYDPAVFGAPPVRAPRGTRYVSDLPFMAAQNGWGPVERDESNGEAAAGDGHPIAIRGATFAKGLGAHADGDIAVYLGGRCTSFTAIAGIDDETKGAGAVRFSVLADGRPVATTGTLTGTSPPLALSANVRGARQLDLVVTAAGLGNGNDHADWANARLDCAR